MRRSLEFFRFAWQESSLNVVGTFEFFWNEMNACMNEWLNVLDGMRWLLRVIIKIAYHGWRSIAGRRWWCGYATGEWCWFFWTAIHVLSHTGPMTGAALEMPCYVLNLVKNVSMFFAQLLPMPFKIIQVMLSRLIALRKNMDHIKRVLSQKKSFKEQK